MGSRDTRQKNREMRRKTKKWEDKIRTKKKGNKMRAKKMGRRDQDGKKWGDKMKDNK